MFNDGTTLQKAFPSIPLFPNSGFPREIVLQILGFLPPKALCAARLTNTYWQITIDQTAALWMPHFYSLKGKRFTEKPLPNPRFFLMLDHALTKHFKNNYPNHISNSAEEENKDEKLNFFERTNSVELENLDLGIVSLKGSDQSIFPLHYVISHADISDLEKREPSSLFSSNSSLKITLAKILKFIAENKFSREFTWHKEDDRLNAHNDLLMAYRKKDPPMVNFIKQFTITHIFLNKQDTLIILGKKAHKIMNKHLVLATNSERFAEKIKHTELFKQLNEGISVFLDPESHSLSLFYDQELKEELSKLIKSSSSLYKEDFEVLKLTEKKLHPYFEKALQII